MKLISGLAAVAVAASTLAVAAPAQAAQTAPADLAGDWIAGEVVAGLAAGDFAFYPGQLIDAGLALDETGHQAEALAVGDELAPMLVGSGSSEFGYVTSDEYDWQAPYDFIQVGRYANATAKAAAFTQRIGQDAATRYADIDLIAQLEDLTSDTTGMLADDSSFGNYANAIGQSFAVEALAQAGSSETGGATDALLAQQCPAGYFLFTLGATDCSAVPSADTTALVVISLVESDLGSTKVKAAVALATQWLESVQRPNGSFEGDASAPGENSNSTGLAGTALGKAGRTALATKAAAWIRGLQAADAGACATKAPIGAIAYNADDLASARADGLGTKRTTWRIASYQAAPALNWAPAASVALGISAPATAPASSKVAVVVRGLAAGEHGCVTFGSTKRLVTGTGADMTISFDLPATSPATHTFSVTTLSGTQSASTAVAAPAAAEPVVGDLSVARVVKVGKRNTFKVAIACDSTVDCVGKLKVRTVGKIERADGTKKVLVVAKKAYTVRAGETAKVRLALTKPARAVLSTKRIRVVAVQTAAGADPARTKFWLRRK